MYYRSDSTRSQHQRAQAVRQAGVGSNTRGLRLGLGFGSGLGLGSRLAHLLTRIACLIACLIRCFVGVGIRVGHLPYHHEEQTAEDLVVIAPHAVHEGLCSRDEGLS